MSGRLGGGNWRRHFETQNRSISSREIFIGLNPRIILHKFRDGTSIRVLDHSALTVAAASDYRGCGVRGSSSVQAGLSSASCNKVLWLRQFANLKSPIAASAGDLRSGNWRGLEIRVKQKPPLGADDSFTFCCTVVPTSLSGSNTRYHPRCVRNLVEISFTNER